MQWAMASMSTSSPTLPVERRRKRMTWQSVDSLPQAPNRLRGSAWPENFNVIGRAQKDSEKLLRFYLITPVLREPLLRGNSLTKPNANRHRARRTCGRNCGGFNHVEQSNNSHQGRDRKSRRRRRASNERKLI